MTNEEEAKTEKTIKKPVPINPNGKLVRYICKRAPRKTIEEK